MTAPLLRVAVVGHTNTGKTSLMRTLMRDVDFGEVSDRPAVTRDVEAAVLQAGGRPALELFDTPGLEDSIGLLELLDERRGDRRLDGIDVIREFLDTDEAHDAFRQESKAIRQVLDGDLALYVIDARERVRGKHRDELEILGRCARPVVPVLNFTADASARTTEWREHLARVSMHAVAEFDTVVYDQRDEERLFEKMRSLLDSRGETLRKLSAERREQRGNLVHASSSLLAEMLIDVAAFALAVPSSAAPSARPATSPATPPATLPTGVEPIDRLKQMVRDREQRCVDQLLALHRFRAGDVLGADLPIEDGRWGIDLFSPAALKEFGIHAGGAAATGAMVGLTLDVMLAGLSLGTATAAGAAVGGLIGAARTHGRRIVDRLRGISELRCDDRTLRLLATRQIALVQGLLRRGHASMDAIRLSGTDEKRAPGAANLPRSILMPFARARVNPHWSELPATTTGDRERGRLGTTDPDREETVHRLADALFTLIDAGGGGAVPERD